MAPIDIQLVTTVTQSSGPRPSHFLCPSSPSLALPLVISDSLSLEGVLPLGEVDVLLVLLGNEVGLACSVKAFVEDGPGLLVTEVEGKVCRMIMVMIKLSHRISAET